MNRAGKFHWTVYLVILAVIVLFAAAPFLSVLFTYAIADANNCVVNEATTHPCLVLGMDLGGLLYFTGLMGWFMLATIPLGGGALIVWFVLLLIHYLAWRQKAGTP
ncbi:hypothetical protein SAMN06295905_3268 [Devosia lucknowensis]|uniref:Uncharacterized protein n=1 Tax=Devosia lucknowensis TaxID=1096929 RepID=A0A1Y6G726_9HYPH|nr:hypothetical protein [Devosia lucknowensis]SMQ85972.1 hypothetical protein SAMN06295905_3268 [Devosia lucknowensis]